MLTKENLKLGATLRDLRIKQKIKLIDLAAQTGIQIATLSRIEHEKMIGTITSHMKIAKVLGVDLLDLYKNSIEGAKAAPQFKTGRANSEAIFFNDKVSYKSLVNNAMTKKMMPSIICIKTGGKTDQECGTPESEGFLFVLKGSVSAYVGDKNFKLKSDKAFYFNASIPYHFRNDSKTTAKFVLIITPSM